MHLTNFSRGITGPGEIRITAPSPMIQMPIGTHVQAARAGKVVHVEERYMDSTRKAGEENVIVIRHDDGPYARYYQSEATF